MVGGRASLRSAALVRRAAERGGRDASSVASAWPFPPSFPRNSRYCACRARQRGVGSSPLAGPGRRHGFSVAATANAWMRSGSFSADATAFAHALGSKKEPKIAHRIPYRSQAATIEPPRRFWPWLPTRARADVPRAVICGVASPKPRQRAAFANAKG
jgi:hypothetical protein